MIFLKFKLTVLVSGENIFINQAKDGDCELLTLFQGIGFQSNGRAFLYYDQH